MPVGNRNYHDCKSYISTLVTDIFWRENWDLIREELYKHMIYILPISNPLRFKIFKAIYRCHACMDYSDN